MLLNNIKSSKVPFWCSWPVIIIATILFYPLGIILLLFRIAKDRRTKLIAGRIISTLGVLGIVFALLAYFMDENIVTTVFGIAGVLFFILGIMLQKRAKRVRQNIDLIANKKITNLDQMAAMTGVSFADLQKELTQMIREGFINGQIKQSSREIVINKSQSQTRNTEAQNASQAAQVKQVSCKSCGAHTTMALHETKECEYCGMLIAGSE